MHDEHLDGEHLDTPRREQFRLACDQIVEACGSETLAGTPLMPREPPVLPDATVIPGHEPRRFATGPCVLSDGDVHPLRLGLNTIGRMPENDIVVTEMHVSRRHCVLVLHAGGRCELHDLASRNGTFVNGKPVKGPVVLSSGDEIRLGKQRLVFVTRPDAQNAEDTSS